MIFGFSGKKDKKEKIKRRNKLHNLINLQAKLHAESRERMQEESGMFLDTRKMSDKEKDEKVAAVNSRLHGLRNKVLDSKTAAQRKWSVASTSDGAFVVR